MTYGRNKEAKTGISPKGLEAVRKLQNLARQSRQQNNTETPDIDYTIPIGYETRIGHLNHKLVKRIVIYLRSSGCEWVKRTGGCTMCGFYSATSYGSKISEHEYVSQFENALDAVDLNEYPIVCIYNDGNFFNENEISMKTIEKICGVIAKYEKVQKVVVETRIEYVTQDNAKKVKKSLWGKELEIAIGFETSNQLIMNLCINKGFSVHQFEGFFDSMRNVGVSIKPLLLLKPPFLTEAESIADVLSTIGYLSLKGIDYVDLEITTVLGNTVVHELWKNNLYRPPWLWSIVAVLLKCEGKYHEKIHLYISPRSYSVECIDEARNCGKCDQDVKRCIDLYNYDFDTTVFGDLDCSCRNNEWLSAVKETDALAIPERIINQLKAIECRRGR